MLQSRFLKLPPELLTVIIKILPSADQLSLRQACNHLNSIISPIVFQSIRGGAYFTGEKQRRFLIATSNSDSHLAGYIRKIQFEFLDAPNQRRSDVMEIPAEGKAIMRPEEIIVKYLVPFVEKLVNLNRLTWEYCSYDLCNPKFYLPELTTAFAKLPNLKELNLSVWRNARSDDIPDLSGFQDLHSLEINSRIYSGTEDYLRSRVMPAIAASPELRTLHFSAQEAIHSFEFDMLMREFNVWQTDGPESTTTTSYLQDLKLVNIPVRLSSLHVRHVFQNLKHLTLLHGDPWERKNTLNGIAWVEIWEALTDAGKDGLWLETLNTEGAQAPNGLKALFQYLVAHPGLKGLSIHGPPYTRGERGGDWRIEDPGSSPEKLQENVELATFFWTEIVPRFSHSLKELTVDPPHSGPWSYGPNASKALTQCTRLKKLSISVSDVPVDWAEEKAANFEMLALPPQPSQDYLGDLDEEYRRPVVIPWGALESTPVLLASDMAHLRELEDVNITLAEPDIDRGWCGSGLEEESMIRIEWATQQLLRFVPWEGYPHKLLGANGIIRIEN